MKKTSKGKLAELIALEWFVKKDMQIAIPFSGQSGWDFLVFVNENWLRVQVKCAYKRKDAWYVDTMKGGGYKRETRDRKYKGNEFDVLLAVDVDGNNIWHLQMSECKLRRCVKLCV